MYISKVKIQNFKSYRNLFVLELNPNLNILVGNNETGKSTILEAIHLTLTGLSNGKYLKNDLSEYFFNHSVVRDYLDSLTGNSVQPPPEITIEVFLKGEGLAVFEGDHNADKVNECGFCLKIALDDRYLNEYNAYIRRGCVTALPIEFYEVTWTSCARETITPRSIPIKSALIDSSSNRYRNGSDVYISHIIRNHLNESQKTDLIHAHRKMQHSFVNDDAVIDINEVIRSISVRQDGDKQVKLTVDLSSRDAWESSFMTAVEDIPFHHIGKGEQSVIKTKLALEHKKVREANIILIEEPENHLSHSKLSSLISDISKKCFEKQILISTHNSFVANKLGLESLILLENKLPFKLGALGDNTQNFFRKIPGYDTLRLILCKKAILVEGDCDELIVQRAYMDANSGKLPIQDEIDVISVGTSFLRFLEIARKIGKRVSVVTDNDGDIGALRKKYECYLDDHATDKIKICFDEDVDTGNLEISGKPFNYNTLEPKLVKSISKELMEKILVRKVGDVEQLHKYMRANKTDCALKIFETNEQLVFPKYILDAIAK
jgi:putative ATP-dependent endonuclease of OLD family